MKGLNIRQYLDDILNIDQLNWLFSKYLEVKLKRNGFSRIAYIIDNQFLEISSLSTYLKATDLLLEDDIIDYSTHETLKDRIITIYSNLEAYM
jgi:hypothetical protein